MNAIEGTQTFYDDLAPLYDAATSGGAWTPNDVLAATLQELGLQPESIVDLGCGTGQTIEVLRTRFPSASIIGVDFSANMVATTRAKFPGLDIRQRDIGSFVREDMPVADLVTAVGCLEFVPALPTVLNDIANQLSPGGQLIFTYEPLISGLTGQSDRTIESSGAIIKSAGTITTYHWTPHEILSSLERYNVNAGDLFVSYKRAEYPVVYHLVSVTK